MFGNFFLSIFILVSISGCARPKYVNINNNNNTESAKETASDCKLSFTNSQICLVWFWETLPTSTTVGSLIFKTYQLNQFDQTPIEKDMESLPQLVLWMSSMGHGSTPSQTQRLDVGTYRASNVFFIMPGDWQLKFQIKNGNELLDEAQDSIIF